MTKSQKQEYGVGGAERSERNTAEVARYRGEEVTLVWSMESRPGGLHCQAEEEELTF